ncbi:hypothetical protein MY11210_005596 [Beauveria gryllotalpidicola]
MRRNVKRLAGVAAAVVVANATAVPVLCGAIDAVWQEQAAVASNYPECDSYYDGSNVDQTVDLDSNHPHMALFNACRRYGATIWACPTIGEHDVDDGTQSEQADETDHEPLMGRHNCKRSSTTTTGWRCPGSGRHEPIDDTKSEQTHETDHEPLLARQSRKRFPGITAWHCPGAGKRDAADDTESEQTDEADHEPLLARQSCKRSSGIGSWRCPGAGKRALIGIEAALAASKVDAKVVGLGLDVASKPPGNWPPHKRLDVFEDEG